jgi:hypothetical protein
MIYEQQAAENGHTIVEAGEGITVPTTLPPEIARDLFDLARRGRIREIKQKLLELAESDVEYQPFIEKLRPLAERYRTKQIEDLLKPFV